MTILKNILISIGLILAPIKMALLVAVGLCITDLILGIAAARKRGDVVHSLGLRRTILKIFVYESAIICSFLVETYLTGPDLMILKLVTALIGLTELKSVLENLNELSDGSILQVIINKLGSIDVKPPEGK